MFSKILEDRARNLQKIIDSINEREELNTLIKKLVA